MLVEGAGAVMATAAAEACALTAPVAVALAVSLICSPGVADLRTLTLTCNSSVLPAGSFPRSHADPSREGQTVNRGELTPLARLAMTPTSTSLLFAAVLQTQIAYVMVPPRRMCPELEKD